MFATNAAVLVLATASLVFAPVRVSVPIALTEVIVLVVGLLVMLALNLVLLRPAFGPFNELAERMRHHDPLSPGARVRVSGGPNVAALAGAFNEMLDRLESERRDSARRALVVQEDERRRVAHELHDEVGQTLTGVILQAESLAAVFGEQSGVRVERRLQPDVPLSDEQELVVYRVAQEALTNVARHAAATRVELRLERDDGRVVLTVRDDGHGLSATAGSSSHGIRGMRERALLIEAQLTITGSPDRGTEVRLSLLEPGSHDDPTERPAGDRR